LSEMEAAEAGAVRVERRWGVCSSTGSTEDGRSECREGLEVAAGVPVDRLIARFAKRVGTSPPRHSRHHPEEDLQCGGVGVNSAGCSEDQLLLSWEAELGAATHRVSSALHLGEASLGSEGSEGLGVDTTELQGKGREPAAGSPAAGREGEVAIIHQIAISNALRGMVEALETQVAEQEQEAARAEDRHRAGRAVLEDELTGVQTQLVETRTAVTTEIEARAADATRVQGELDRLAGARLLAERERDRLSGKVEEAEAERDQSNRQLTKCQARANAAEAMVAFLQEQTTLHPSLIATEVAAAK
jgi:hypothetical protein